MFFRSSVISLLLGSQTCIEKNHFSFPYFLFQIYPFPGTLDAKEPKMRYFPILLICLISFSACEMYMRPYPITETPNATLDTTLLGIWYAFGEEEQVTSLDYKLEILPWDEDEYLLVFRELGPETELGLYRMFLSRVDNHTFCNVQYLREDRTYAYFTFQQEGSQELRVDYLVKENWDTTGIRNSKDLETRISATPNFAQQAFSGDPFSFYREGYLTWGKANETWLQQGVALYKINIDDPIFFRETDASVLIRDHAGEPEDLTLFNREMERAIMVEEGKIDRTSAVQFYIFSLKNGRHVKCIKGPNYLEDITHRNGYRMTTQ